MTREQKRRAKEAISSTISGAKSRLLSQVVALEGIGCATDAERLARIIAKLEDFQTIRLR